MLNSSYTGGVFIGFRLGAYDYINATSASSPCEMFVRENGVTTTMTVYPNWLEGAIDGEDHTFVMEVTGVGSNNPFSDTTPLNIKLYIDGGITPILDYTTTDCYSNNYIGMLTYGYCQMNIDSWSVTQMVPEPSTFALLATGLFGLLAYAWRKRK